MVRRAGGRFCTVWLQHAASPCSMLLTCWCHAAYRKTCLEFHPDKKLANVTDEAEKIKVEEHFKAVSAPHTCLCWSSVAGNHGPGGKGAEQRGNGRQPHAWLCGSILACH